MDDAIRRLAREAQADDTVAAWSRLVAELARAGRSEEAATAAVRAAALDPTDEALRARLLPASIGERVTASVPWCGLRAPRRVRSIQGPVQAYMPMGWPRSAGQACVALPDASGATEVHDLVTGALLWRTPHLTVIAGAPGLVVLDPEAHALVTHDPRTGEVRARDVVDGRLHADLRSSLMHAVLVARGRLLAWDHGHAGRLVLHDLVRRRAVGSAMLPARARQLFGTDDGVLAMGGGELVAYDGRGAVRWRAPGLVHEERFLGVVDDRLYVENLHGGPRHVTDLATGERRVLSWPWAANAQLTELCATATTLVLLDLRGQRLVGVDRTTEERLWERPAPPATKGEVMATADAVLLLERGSREPAVPLRAVRSLDPRTGEVVGELPLEGRNVSGSPFLAAGRLLLWSIARSGPAYLTIIGER